MQSSAGTANDHRFYRQVLQDLTSGRIPFLVGGAQMVEQYSGILRELKDLDLYLRPIHVKSALELLSTAGHRTAICFPHWLAKVSNGACFVDVIFSSGNGICEVNDAWFDHALDGEVFGVPVRFCPPEEMIWSKAFIMERERYDGADVAHLFRSCGEYLDWRHLLHRFEPHWRVLLSHLILFGFIYPTERSRIPEWLMQELAGRLLNEMGVVAEVPRLCQGTLLSRVQYLKDITEWGYQDARLLPFGTLTPEEAALWTDAANNQLNSSEMNATFNSFKKGEKHETK